MHLYLEPPEIQTKALLSACGLPTEDLNPENFEHFFACGREDQPAGVVGVEIHGTVALLRSLAVAEASRGLGCGKRLVAEVEAHAVGQDVREIYLLTNTARALFESLGYVAAARESAPSRIRATNEFASICPDSATLMVKHVAA